MNIDLVSMISMISMILPNKIVGMVKKISASMQKYNQIAILRRKGIELKRE